MSRVPPTVLLALLLIPIAGAEDTPAYAPSLVLAERAGTDLVAVEWLPGARTAETYRVYGVQGGGVAFLYESTSAAELAAFVPAGFSSYGVAGVVDGVESPLVVATVGAGGASISCVRIQTDPPSINRGGCRVPLWLEVRGIPW